MILNKLLKWFFCDYKNTLLVVCNVNMNFKLLIFRQNVHSIWRSNASIKSYRTLSKITISKLFT